MIESQKSVIATQNIQESMKFVFEMVGKEIRTAVKSDNFCGGVGELNLTADASPANKIFNVDSSGVEPILYFMNKDKECVSYAIRDSGGVGSWEIRRKKDAYDDSLFVTPDEINLG